MAVRPLSVLSLFAGYGGIDLGIRLAVPGSRAVCFVEREAYAQAVLVARMEDASLDPTPLWDDVCTFDGHPWRGVVDCVAGGFPCQDISGRRAAASSPSNSAPQRRHTSHHRHRAAVRYLCC